MHLGVCIYTLAFLCNLVYVCDIVYLESSMSLINKYVI